MESAMDIAQLVAQMQDTLSTIHTTLASLNTTEHDAKLDELEARRDSTIKHLLAAFSAESEVLHHKRLAEREEIAERRRIEDEERERRRRQEDEELAERNKQEDEARDGRLLHETNEVEEETDQLMEEVEEEAQKVIDEGQKKLMDLEERRKELNHLIEEQLRMPLITSPPRRSRRGSNMPPVVATPSKPPEPMALEPPKNASAKALKPEDVFTDRHDEISEPTFESQTMPQADTAEASILDAEANSQKQASPTNSNDSRPTSCQDRPLFVQPVISRAGTIIHPDQLEQKAPMPAEPIGVPTRNTDSPDAFGSPKSDVTWWENKRREEAERTLCREATSSSLSFHNDAGEPATPQSSAGHDTKDVGLSISSTDTPSLAAATQATPGAAHQDIEHEDEARPARQAPALPQLSPQEEEAMPNEIPRGTSHAGEEIMAATMKAASVGSDSASEYGSSLAGHEIKPPVQDERAPARKVDLLKNDPSPADIPLPLTATGDNFDSAGDTSVESAHEQHATLASALSDHTRSHSGENVSFAADEDQENSHDASFGPTEASVTPEHHESEISAEGDAVSPVSSYHDQPSTEHHTAPSEPAKVVLPPDMDDSCSLTDGSKYCQSEELSEMHSTHRPPLIYSESYTGDDGDDAEVDIPLERVPSRQPSREEPGSDELEDARHGDTEPQANIQRDLDPDSQEEKQDQENLQTPALQAIPEHEALESMPEEPADLELEQQTSGLGIQLEANVDSPVPENEHNPHHDTDVPHDEEVPALSSSSDHGGQDHSYYDDDSHLDDEYAQPKPVTPNSLILQPFRTSDSGDRGSSVCDGDVSELPDDVGRHREGDAEPGVSGAGGQPGDQADLGVLPDHGHMGGGGAEGAQDETNEPLVVERDDADDTALPSAGFKTELNLAEQLRRASQVSNQSVEMEAAYTTTVDGEGELFDDEDAETDDVSDIEDAYLNDESVVDAAVAAMGPEPKGEESARGGSVTEKTPAEVPAEAPVDAALNAQVEPTVEMPEQMAAKIKAEAQTQVPDDTPYATPMEMPVPVEIHAQMQAVVETLDSMPVVSATVPTIETPEPGHHGTSPSWVHEADNYFDEQDDEPQQKLDTPRNQFFEQPRTDITTTAVTSDSRPANQGLSASIHHPGRPQTPSQDTELARQEYPPTPSHGQEEQDSSPQSVRSQSTIDSAPPSPDQHSVTDAHDPVIRGLVSTQSPSYQTGRPRNNSHLTEDGHHRDESEDNNNPFAKWQQRDSTLSVPDQPPIASFNANRSIKHSYTGSEPAGDQKRGSLFQRMRNVFEQQSNASEINTSRPTSTDRHSGGGGVGGGGSGSGSGLWGSGGPLSGRFGKSWSSSSNDHHRDYHHHPYTGAGYPPDPDIVEERSGFLEGREDLN